MSQFMTHERIPAQGNMKKYQLIGKRNAIRKISVNSNYPSIHFYSLPYEILVEIVSLLFNDLDDLVNLAQTCRKFEHLVYKEFLYKDVVIRDHHTFQSFAQSHLPSHTKSFSRKTGRIEPSRHINYIKTLHLVKPPTRETSYGKTQIAGSYDLEMSRSTDDQVVYDSYMGNLNSLLNECFSIKTIIISEISPQFSFPKESHNFITHLFRAKAKRTLRKLVLKAQSGWNIPFKINHMSTLVSIFDRIDELVLHNFVIDTHRLISPSIANKISIDKITLESCIYSSNSRIASYTLPRNVDNDIFKDVSSLALMNIYSGTDLSVIDFVKKNNKLRNLGIDLTSPVFYKLCKGGTEKLFDFHRYNPFFNLICSGQGSYDKIKTLEILNFNLADLVPWPFNANAASFDMHHNEELNSLLTSWSKVENVVIVLKPRSKKLVSCVKCGFTKDVTHTRQHDKVDVNCWFSVLQPLFQNDSNIRIIDHRGELMWKKTRSI